MANVQQNIIKYYTKVTNEALVNLKDEKQFRFKMRLNNRNLMMQSEDHLISVYKSAGGTMPFNPEVKKMIDDYKKSMLDMHTLAVKDYNKTLAELKQTKTIEDKQRILDKYAEKGISGFKSKSGATWNLETYSNMYFTHMNNELIRQGQLDHIKGDLIQISTHNTKCNLCKPYEGKILTRKQLESARSNGLFHPNCLHLIIEVGV